ncbi:ComEC/Rec2 family competence protein [Arthrobacter ginkgonis]|uniref:ComEC/Rec2 family competence protein n=1 Tax=Arthrobacter ginkgonis TaxID=1630594 RepID=A0ABP7CK17_9MICC
MEADPGVVDLRGVWAAAGAWGSAALMVRIPTAQAALGAVAGCLLLALMAWNLRSGRGLVAWWQRGWAPVALAAAGAAVVAASVAIQGAGGQGSAGAEPRWAAMVEARETARVRIVLTGEPETRPAPGGYGPVPHGNGPAAGESRGVEWVAEGQLQAVAVSGAWVSVRSRVTVSWPESLDTDAGGAGQGAGVDAGDATAEEAAVGRGDTLEALGRLSPVAAGRREAAWVGLRSPPTVVPAAEGAVDRAREDFAQAARRLPGDGPALLPGMVMGDRRGQDADLEAAMTRAGLAHLTAVSGANCALVLGTVLGAGRACRLGRTATLLLCLAALAGFVAVVHPEPSVVRAAAMGAVSAVAVYAGRGRQAFAALCACVVGLLAWDPWYAGEAAFRLSVAATAGIALLGRPLAVVLHRVLPGWLADGTAITVSAQAFCLPVLLTFTTDVAAYAVPANLAVAPLVPVATIAGTAALGLAFLPGAGALTTALVWVAGLPAALVGGVGRWFASLPHAHLSWAEGPAGTAAAVLVAAALLAAVWMARAPGGIPERRTAALLAAFAAAVTAGILVPATALVGRDPPDWEVALCDVGQGDALALRTGHGHAIVIDTGPDPEPVRTCLDVLGVEVVDVLMLTHLHADHIGGTEGVFTGREVQQVLYSTAAAAPGGTPDARTEDRPGVEGAELSGRLPATVQARRAFAGERGSAGPVQWEVLWPLAGAPAPTENDASLVVRYRIGADGTAAGRPLTLLAPGDIEEAAMDELLRTGADLRADILKVSHHGARNGGTAVIGAADPRAALVGVGAGNRYGHPAPETLAALEAAGAAVFRTDTGGAVVLRREGNALVTARLEGAGG